MKEEMITSVNLLSSLLLETVINLMQMANTTSILYQKVIALIPFTLQLLTRVKGDFGDDGVHC